MSNDADAIITGEGNAEGVNEKWNEDILSENGNALGNVSVTATDDEYCDDELNVTIVDKTKKR